MLQPLLGIAVLALVLKIPGLMGGGGAGGNVVASLVGTAAGARVGSSVGVAVRGALGAGARAAVGVHENSINSGDLVGGDLGRLAMVISLLVAALLAVPFGLALIGFSAIAGVAGSLDVSTVQRVGAQPAAGSRPADLIPPLAPAASEANPPHASRLLAQARSWLGIRYVFGGCSPSGIDCSCFVQTIFRSVGIDMPRTSQQQFNATVGRGLGTSSPAPGDLVFFFRTYSDPLQDWTHVGVVSRVDSNGVVWMIDAPGARAATDPPDVPFGRVREEPVAGSWLQHRPAFARVLDP